MVVYLLNPYSNPSAIVDLCAAFLRLFESYLQSKRSPQPSSPNEIVLQLVPMGLVASNISVVVPSHTQYKGLALEVYNRCSVGSAETRSGAAAPGNTASFLLAQKIPVSIDFSLTSTAPASLLHEPTDLHIAYSESFDGRWISAAWSDNDGGHQISMSYCLGMVDSDVRRPFGDVAREIWQTSLEVARSRKVRWRFLVAKVGIMEQEELDAWQLVAENTIGQSITPVLLAVDISPPLMLAPESESTINSQNNPTTLYSTPISTPQPPILSPEQVYTAATPTSGTGPTNAATPTDSVIDVEPDSSLVDVTDETWGVVLAHQIQNTDSLTERRPGLASGYLIKRAGRQDEDGIVAMSVNLLLIEQPYRTGLRDILKSYRGLGTVARLKGLEDPVKSVLPWHIAAAVKAQEALSLLM